MLPSNSSAAGIARALRWARWRRLQTTATAQVWWLDLPSRGRESTSGSCPVFLKVDGGVAAANSPPDIRCDPFSALADVANHLSKRGIALAEGAYITTGSATETLPVVPGSIAVADFADLGKIEISFE